MILSDGTTSININTSDNNPDFKLIKSKKTTAGGQLRIRTTGTKFVVNEEMEVTGTQLRAIMDLLTNNAATYTYDPTSQPPEWDSSNFPMAVSIDYSGKTQRIYNGEIRYFIALNIESIEVFDQ